MNNQPFRLVFNSLNNQEFYIIKDLIEWRVYQNLPDVSFFVIKLGYYNTLHHFDFEKGLNFFKDPFFKNKTIKFSLFQNIHEINHEKIQLYENFAYEIKQYNSNFTCSLAFVYDEKINHFNEIESIPAKNHLNYNLYLHHVTNIETITQLFDTKLFNGFDLTSYFNHFEVPSFDNRQTLINILKNLPHHILEDLCPEFLNWEINNKTYKDDIFNFCKDGYYIENQTISPLMYGSFDDFTVSDKVNLNEFLLLTFQDTLQYWNKVLSKKIYNSFCFSCDSFSLCQNKSYLWNNLNESSCSLDIIEFIPIKFDKIID